MSPSIVTHFAALTLTLPAFFAPASAQTSAPHLTHTAPFIGKTLTIRIESAQPFAAISLLYSPSAGSFDGPYGHLELARANVQTVATGIALFDGTWSIDLPVPLDAALAETERHYQALVDDASAPAGRRLSDAAHLRILGPRVYATHAGGIDVFDAVHETASVHVSYTASAFGEPVFDAAFARGAIMSTPRELLFFDPYFGGVRGTVPFTTDCSSKLIVDPAQLTVFVLERGGPAVPRIHAIELATGVETTFFDLPNEVGEAWCQGTPGVELFVAEHLAAGQASVRRIGMSPLADLGSGIVGDPTQTNGGLPQVLYAGGQLFSWTLAPEPQPPHFLTGTWNRTRISGSAFGTRTSNLYRTRMYAMTAVPDADWILGAWMATDVGPVGGMCQIPISSVGPPRSTVTPPRGPDLFPSFVEADGTTAWVIAQWEWGENNELYRFDLAQNTWTIYPQWWYFDVPVAAELVRDPLTHALWVSSQTVPGAGIRPRITVVDELHGTTRKIPLFHQVDALFAVPIP